MTNRLRGTMELIFISIVLFAGEFYILHSPPFDSIIWPSSSSSVVTVQVHGDEPTITSSTSDISLLLNETAALDVAIQGLPTGQSISLHFYVQHDDLIKVDPLIVTLDSDDKVYKVDVTGLHPG